MADLLFWFLVSQTVAGLPDMAPGTQVWVMAPDLFTKYATAVVEGETLSFSKPLDPGEEIRLLIYPPNSDERARADLSQALQGRISQDGEDILLRFEELDGPLSFRKWLSEERGIILRIPLPTPNSGRGPGGNE
ncbi:MAG TPA: hypothetical protein VF171_05945 [Trueperaceae bacterium]